MHKKELETVNTATNLEINERGFQSTFLCKGGSKLSFPHFCQYFTQNLWNFLTKLGEGLPSSKPSNNEILPEITKYN